MSGWIKLVFIFVITLLLAIMILPMAYPKVIIPDVVYAIIGSLIGAGLVAFTSIYNTKTETDNKIKFSRRQELIELRSKFTLLISNLENCVRFKQQEDRNQYLREMISNSAFVHTHKVDIAIANNNPDDNKRQGIKKTLKEFIIRFRFSDDPSKKCIYATVSDGTKHKTLWFKNSEIEEARFMNYAITEHGQPLEYDPKNPRKEAPRTEYEDFIAEYTGEGLENEPRLLGEIHKDIKSQIETLCKKMSTEIETLPA